MLKRLRPTERATFELWPVMGSKIHDKILICFCLTCGFVEKSKINQYVNLKLNKHESKSRNQYDRFSSLGPA